MEQKDNFQNAGHFFIFGVKFPSPLFNNHFRIIVEIIQCRRIIFFIRPFESLIGRRFSQFYPVKLGNTLFIHYHDVTHSRNCIRFPYGTYIKGNTVYIQFYFNHILFVLIIFFFLVTIVIERKGKLLYLSEIVLKIHIYCLLVGGCRRIVKPECFTRKRVQVIRQ